MGVKDILLSSKAHWNNMLTSLNELRLLGHLSDVTVRVDYKDNVQEFKAHQLMLAASSGYFKTIVLSEHWVQDKILLTNIDAADFSKYLEFVYTGKVQVRRKEIEDVLVMARFLDCKDLVKVCEEENAKVPQKRKKETVCAAAAKENEENPRRSKRKKKSKKLDSDDSDYSPNTIKTSGKVSYGKTLKLRLPRQIQSAAKATEPEENSDSTGVDKDEPVKDTNEKKSKNTPQSDDEEWSPKDSGLNDEDDDSFFVGFDEEGLAGEENMTEEGVKWTSKAPFECTKCQRTFHYEKSFLKHISTYHGEKAEIIYRCETCQQTFANRSNLKTHEKHVHSEERLFSCGTCTKTFKRKKDVIRHQRQVHERDSRKHVCSICGKSLSCRAALLLHERIHSGTKPFQCSLCDAKFTQKTALKMHYRTHTGERPFACNLCSARFTQKHMLAYHIRSHTGERPFMCEACGKSFSSREYLRHHSNIHTGVKPFKCEHCGRGFSQRNSLSQHLKIHTGDRPYRCTFCEKHFTQLSALQRHQRIHTGEKPYMCSTCNRTFTDTSTLRRHTKTHSPDAPWKSFLVVLDGNIEDKKPPPELKSKSPKTGDKKSKKSSNSSSSTGEDEAKSAITTTQPITATECSTVTVPSDWASHGAIALVSHAALGGITVIHTEIPPGTKLQPIVTTDSTGASVLSLDNPTIAVPFSIAANVAHPVPSSSSIPTVTVSNGTLAIVTESQSVPVPSVLEVAASQTILAPESEEKFSEGEGLPPNVETVIVGDTAGEVEVKSDMKDDDLEQSET